MAAGRGRLEAPNHTQTPNELLDYWMPLMSGAEFKVHMAICRKTFGWHQHEDRISMSQLQRLTGLSKRAVQQAVEHGLLRGTMRRRAAGDSYAYALVIDGQLSLGVGPAGGAKSSRGGAKSSQVTGAESSQLGGAESSHTKESRKETREINPSRGRGLSARDRRTLDRLRTVEEEEAAV